MTAAPALQTGAEPAPVAPPGRGWIAVWQSGHALEPPPMSPDPAPLPELTLCLEFTLPLRRPGCAVRVWQGAAEAARAIGLYALPDGALRLVHHEIDLATRPDFARPGETVTLRYRACARGRGDVADFINHDRPQRQKLRAGLAQAARLDEALPRDPRFLEVCHVAAVAGFGVAPTDLPAFASGAVVPTTEGRMPVEALRPGMSVLTVGGERMALRWIESRARLCLGRLAPVRLRAPYFGLARDICVTAETRVLRKGPVIEYIFGHERVLIRAGDMTVSPGAVRDRQVPVRVFHHLMLDDHACLPIDGCGVETALLSDVIAAEDASPRHSLSEADRTPCLPVLDRAGAQAVLAAGIKGRRALG
jgi:hypothetical protein